MPVTQPEAPLTIRVGSVTQPEAPLTIRVTGITQPEAPLTIQVVDVDAYDDPGGWWVPRVTLGGVDVTARCTGRIHVEAEEGAARVAEFSLTPTGAPFSAVALLGQAVTIDFSKSDAAHAMLTPVRLFTGRVADPQWDATNGITSLRCADSLIESVDAASRASLDALIAGARWSPHVFDEALQGWDYAQALLSTVPTAVDCDAGGALRMTAWAAKTTPDWTITAPIYQSERLELGAWRDFTNVVTVDFGYRYPVLAKRQLLIDWKYHGYGTCPTALGIPVVTPTMPTVLSAIDATGWEHSIVSEHKTNIWDTLVDDAQWRMWRRYAQTLTERYQLRVSAPGSESLFGEQAATVSAHLEVDFDAAAWEQDPDALPAFTIQSHGEERLSMTSQAEDGRAVADQAIETLIVKARRQILAAHRAHRMRFAVPLNPLLDLPHTIRLQGARITAKGKVSHLVHTMDLYSGEATTEVTLLLSGSGYVGGQADTPVAAPAPPAIPVPVPTGLRVTWGSQIQLYDALGGNTIYPAGFPAIDWEMPGFAVILNEYGLVSPDLPEKPPISEFGGVTFAASENQFLVAAPEIPSADRDPAEAVQQSATFEVAIPEDELVTE